MNINHNKNSLDEIYNVNTYELKNKLLYLINEIENNKFEEFEEFQNFLENNNLYSDNEKMCITHMLINELYLKVWFIVKNIESGEFQKEITKLFLNDDTLTSHLVEILFKRDSFDECFPYFLLNILDIILGDVNIIKLNTYNEINEEFNEYCNYIINENEFNNVYINDLDINTLQ